MIQRVLTPMNLLEFSSPILFNHIHFGCRSAAHALCAGTVAKPKDGKFKGKQWKWALIGEALWQSSARLYNSEMLNGVICFCFGRVVFCIESEHLNLLYEPSNLKLNPRSFNWFSACKGMLTVELSPSVSRNTALLHFQDCKKGENFPRHFPFRVKL